jgi:histone acetyltransferase MYST1
MDPTLFARLEAEREEITKVKNVPRVQLGRWSIEAWYYSPYPPDVATGGPLFVCEYTLKYMNSARAWARHRKANTVRAPPGEKIYSDGTLALWEVDGVHQELYCQNLCLLSKLFLDHKTLYFDVKPFLFYVLTEFRDNGHEPVGYFSKEKHSDLDYNLACILTLPPYQRCGYGKLLISFSYELTKREKKVGSPEKPISDLGKISYRSYWTFVLLSALQHYDGQWTISDLSNMTGIKVEDVISTLQALELIKHWKGQTVVVVSKAAMAEALAHLQVPRLCDDAKLTWQPPAGCHDLPSA